MKASARSRFPLMRVFVLAMFSAAGFCAAQGGGGPTRLTPSEIHWPATGNEAPGSSMQGAVQSLIIYGDGSRATLYSIMFKVGPNAAIPAHWHPDNRSCFVMVGVWYFGYGDTFNKAALKAYPPGSHTRNLANGIISPAPNRRAPPSNVHRSDRPARPMSIRTMILDTEASHAHGSMCRRLGEQRCVCGSCHQERTCRHSQSFATLCTLFGGQRRFGSLLNR